MKDISVAAAYLQLKQANGICCKSMRDQLDAANAEIARLRQGYWDARAIMGFDNDGDPTPVAVASDYVAMMLSDARSMRADYDEACAELDSLP